MSSVLNVSNDASREPEELMFVYSEEQNWFKRTHVGKFLDLRHIDRSVEGLDKCKMLTRKELIPTSRGMGGWSGL